MESVAQKRANKRWRKKNRNKDKIYSYRSTAKRFITRYAQVKDLRQLLDLIHKRFNVLKKKS